MPSVRFLLVMFIGKISLLQLMGKEAKCSDTGL
jgi:hypothetical protein